jgi:Na+-transporting NADH:ubiquinone oxidoreductase subunit A
MRVKIRRGQDVSLSGKPASTIRNAWPIDMVALQGSDYPDLRPDFRVAVGDKVKAGQVLFVDRKRPEICFVSPASGTIGEITYGRRRMLDLVVVNVDGDENQNYAIPDRMDDNYVRALLLETGQWPAFRTRPFGRIPDPGAVPDAIFVTAINTEPLGEDVATVLQPHLSQFRAGLETIRHLTAGPVYLCQPPDIPTIETPEQVQTAIFDGPHPAGLPGTHIHSLHPASRTRQVWHIGYQDVIAIGHLVSTGQVFSERVIALAGAAVRTPGLVSTRLGAHLNALVADELREGEINILSGSALSGRPARYLGRFHNQVSVLFQQSTTPSSAMSRFFGGLVVKGHADPIIPITAYDNVMPLDILPVPLLRALSVGDVETAELLGCLELTEEDMALLTHICPTGLDYPFLLRQILNQLEEQMA